MDAPGVVAGADDVGELIGQHLGAETVERPLVVGPQHPPARLALGPELLDEHARPTRKAQPNDTVLGPRRLGWVLHVDPATLGQMHEQPWAPRVVSGGGPRGKLADQAPPATGNFAEPMANARFPPRGRRRQRRALA